MLNKLTTLSIALYCLAFTPSSLALFGPSNYAECIFANVNQNISARGITHIETECRERFPEPSTSFFSADETKVCYNKHQDLVNNRFAAKAIWKACNDYHQRPTYSTVQ